MSIEDPESATHTSCCCFWLTKSIVSNTSYFWLFLSLSLLLLLLIVTPLTTGSSEYPDWLQLHWSLLDGGSKIVTFITSPELDSRLLANIDGCCTLDLRLMTLGEDNGGGCGRGDSDVLKTLVFLLDLHELTDLELNDPVNRQP